MMENDGDVHSLFDVTLGEALERERMSCKYDRLTDDEYKQPYRSSLFKKNSKMITSNGMAAIFNMLEIKIEKSTSFSTIIV